MPKKANKPVGPSSLLAGVQKGDLETVQRLIQAGERPERDACATAAASCNRAFAKVKPATQEKLFLPKASSKERSQGVADAEKFLKIVEALLHAGAPVPNGELCVAARRGYTPLALLLIRHGADVNYDPPMGTPLENAVESGDLEIIEALIRAGADIHHWGFKGGLVERAVSVGQPAAADALLAAGVNANAQKAKGSTALLHAVTERKLDFVKKLLGAGADVNQKGAIICGDFGDPEVSDEGMFRTTHIPNPPFARDATPLIVATRRGYADVAQVLIAAGAELEAVDQEGFTALAHATKSNNQELIRLLSRLGRNRWSIWKVQRRQRSLPQQKAETPRDSSPFWPRAWM